MISISAAALKEKLNLAEDIQVIDVREPWEHELFNIGGILLPLGSIMEHIDLVEKNKPVIFYCQKGIRSQIAIQRLQQKYGFTNLLNLAGGMDAWKKQIP